MTEGREGDRRCRPPEFHLVKDSYETHPKLQQPPFLPPLPSSFLAA